jgi:hypothetical protein
MIKKDFKTFDGKITISIPENLKELTIGQLAEMNEEPNRTTFRLISILSYVPENTLANLNCYLDLEALVPAFSSLLSQLNAGLGKMIVPSEFQIRYKGRVKYVKVAKDLAFEPAGAYVQACSIIAEEIEIAKQKYGANWRDNFGPSYRSQIRILANFFYQRVTGEKYNVEGVEDFYNTVKFLPVSIAVPVARYFFLKYPNLQKKKTSFWQAVQLIWKKKQASNNLENLKRLTR